MVSDKLIINKFKCGSHHHICKSKIDSLNDEEQKYLKNRFNDSSSIKESIFRILICLETKPICPECGKPVKIRYRYNNPCYHTCGDKKCIRKRKSHGPEESNLAKYGVKNQFQREEIKQQIIQNNLIKYGSKSHTQSKEWQDKNKQLNIEKFGVDNVFKLPSVKDKIKKTCLERYGVNHFSKTEIWKTNMSIISSSIEFQEKRNETLRKNNTWNSSKDEEYIYKELCNIFNDVKRQYSSDKYPFNCDFYIPKLDLYLEYNGSDLHNFKPFTNSIEDQNKLKILKDKSNKLKIHNGNKRTRYDNRIYTWTDLDVRKRTIAKTNELNFIELWNIEEFNKWKENYV